MILPRKRSTSGETLETGSVEMTIERKYIFESMPLHEDKGNAVGVAHVLIMKVLEEPQGLDLVIYIGPKYRKTTRGAYCADLFGYESISRNSPHIRQQFIQDIAREKEGTSDQCIPYPQSFPMILVPLNISGYEGSGIDEYPVHGSTS